MFEKIHDSGDFLYTSWNRPISYLITDVFFIYVLYYTFR